MDLLAVNRKIQSNPFSFITPKRKKICMSNFIIEKEIHVVPAM